MGAAAASLAGGAWVPLQASADSWELSLGSHPGSWDTLGVRPVEGPEWWWETAAGSSTAHCVAREDHVTLSLARSSPPCPPPNPGSKRRKAAGWPLCPQPEPAMSDKLSDEAVGFRGACGTSVVLPAEGPGMAHPCLTRPKGSCVWEILKKLPLYVLGDSQREESGDRLCLQSQGGHA
jgi:hypothetical protein